MKKKPVSVLGAISCAIIGLLGVSCSSDKKPELHVYNWADYLDEDVMHEFEETYGCKVVMDFFDSNEAMYAKIKAGASGYDVIFPSSYQAAIMHEEGLIQNIDLAQVPNAANVDPAYLKGAAIDSTMTYSVPYMTGTTGVGYSSTVLPDLPHTWSVFLMPEVKNRPTLLNDMRETLGAGLKFLGYSLNTVNEEEIAQAAEVVKKWKGNIAKFENEQYKPGIASGEFILVHGYSGDISQVVEENEEAAIEYMLPEEGFVVWCDDMVIPSNAPNAELALKFINFMLDGKIAARNMEFTYYKAPNVAAYDLIPSELKEDTTVFVEERLMAKAEVVRPLGEKTQLYTKYWDQVKAAE